MAIFPEGAVNGLKAAIDFLKKVDLFNQTILNQNQPPIRVGIGLHTGEVIMGVCGGQQSIQCTVIGDCVNLTARLEGLSSRYKTALVISEDLHQDAQSDFDYDVRELEYVRVKGRSKPILVYEVLDVLPADQKQRRLQTKTRFQQGLQAMQNHLLIEGKNIFEEIVQLDPSDTVASLHLQTLEALLNGEALIDDQGASILVEK